MEVKLFATRTFQPGNIFGILKALQHLLIFLNGKNYGNRFAIFRDDLGFRYLRPSFDVDLVAQNARLGEILLPTRPPLQRGRDGAHPSIISDGHRSPLQKDASTDRSVYRLRLRVNFCALL